MSQDQVSLRLDLMSAEDISKWLTASGFSLEVADAFRGS